MEEANVKIDNKGQITCNENLIYGEVDTVKPYNVDNNWWGKNESPIETNIYR